MTPASPSIYKCPDCQNETRVFRGHIGPQFRNISRLWSDMSSINETISYKISPIIECSHCGHFFMMNGDGIISPDNDVKLGKRDWESKPKIEDVYRELTERGLNKNQKFVLLLNMIQGYNWDFHSINKESHIIPTAEQCRHKIK